VLRASATTIFRGPCDRLRRPVATITSPSLRPARCQPLMEPIQVVAVARQRGPAWHGGTVVPDIGLFMGSFICIDEVRGRRGLEVSRDLRGVRRWT